MILKQKRNGRKGKHKMIATMQQGHESNSNDEVKVAVIGFAIFGPID